MTSPAQKYGIKLVQRSKKQTPKTGMSSGEVNPTTMDSAKKVIRVHRQVIRALAKR
jgi:hypothetical protein